MSISILIDVNLSPSWVPFLQASGWTAVHWSSVGDLTATDRTILDWASANQFIVLTHDLDFGTVLALTHRSGPSVVQVRARDVLPEHIGSMVSAALVRHEAELKSGALVVIDEIRSRVRILPI